MFSNFKDLECEGTLAVSFSGVRLSADAFAKMSFSVLLWPPVAFIKQDVHVFLWTTGVQQWFLESGGGRVYEQHFDQG